MSKKRNDPSSTSRSYDEMFSKWKKIQCVLEGTESMRAAGRAYLPQHDKESDLAYDERLQRNVLFNMSEMTLESWVGKPFCDPVKFTDVPPVLESLFENVDLLGNNIQVFCRNWFREGLAKSFSHVYVDFPRKTEVVGRVRTLADDRLEQLRPYLIHYNPERVFFADVDTVDGRDVLREVRIMEEVCSRDGFNEEFVPQIRRIYLQDGVVSVELYREEGTRRKQWVVVDSYTVSIGVIPMVTFYANRTGFMTGKSPLEDLVDLNISHWQSNSDQRACLTVARFPILACSGATDDEKTLVVGPNRWLHTPDPQGRIYYVEHTGKAIDAGRKDLLDLENQMAGYGSEFLKKKPAQTATERVLDGAEASSPLKDVVVRFGSSLDEVLALMAKWMNLEKGGTADASTEFGEDVLGGDELRALTDIRRGRDMSRTAFLRELQRRGVISEEYDIEADAVVLEQEMMALFGTTAPKDQNVDNAQ